MAHVFVTGATGYLGRELSARLASRGHAVRALARRGSEQRVARGCELVLGDALDEESYSRAVPPCAMSLALLMAAHAVGCEPELVLRLQRRDPQALAELYDRYGRLAYALILRVVRDAAIAEDLVQETFLRVWNRVHGFDAGRGALGLWLLAVARNQAIDYLRSSGGRERSSFALEQTEHPSLYSDVEQEILAADSARRIKAAMAKLSAPQREVIELAYFEGLSQTEMAERMGQPLGTVKTWVRTALRKLRDELGAVVTA